MPEPVDPLSLRSATAFALGKVKLPSTGQRLAEADRQALAAAVAEHFRLCRWEVMASAPQLVPDSHYGPSARPK